MPIKNFPVQLEVIEMFLDRASSVNDEYVQVFYKEYTEEEWDEYGEAEYEHATDMLLFYQEIVTRAALGELNALVEHELKWIAESILRERQGESFSENKRLSRGEARIIVEEEFSIDLQDLPGYPEVDNIRRIVNAYKHENGYGDEYDASYVIFEKQQRYQLDPDEVPKYVDAVRQFLNNLPGELSSLGSRGPRTKWTAVGREFIRAKDARCNT